jgi:hypothetical protein
MFLPTHEIWKFAHAGDELDDWLPYAKDLVEKWSRQNKDEVKFNTTFEIIIGAYLLKDDLLPASAKAAFAEIMFNVIAEAQTLKSGFKSLHIPPTKPGRKESRRDTWRRLRGVYDLIREGCTATEAYNLIAEKEFKSPETIRREYERFNKKNRERKKDGGNDK